MQAVALSMILAVASPQEDERVQKIMDRVVREIEAWRIRLTAEVLKIVREELARPAATPANKPVLLGVVPDELTDAERKALGITGGIKVAEVTGPAEKAGVKPGDILVSIGGANVSEATIAAALARHKPGDEVEVTVIRSKARRTLKVTLEERRD
jgi:S1-C subfamily serine protease